MEEIWKDIEGYEGLYQVSNIGRVKSLEKYVKTGGGYGLHFLSERILKQGKGSRGYLQVRLGNGKKQKMFAVHRLVAQAFIPNPDSLPQVNHKDENKENNCVDNLEWCSSKYNCNYGSRNCKIGSTQKESGIQRNNKYTSKEVYQYTLDGIFVNTYPSMHEAARQTGLDNSAISKVCRGKIKYTGGFIWSYTPLPCHSTQL